MEHESVFPYDAFLSHRTGDAAADLHVTLGALGCRVWWDENKPLTERRLNKVIAPNFAGSRTIVAFLSTEFAKSPWPILEVRSALATESEGSRRTIFYVPDNVVVDQLGLPDDVMEAFRARRPYGAACIEALAGELRRLNALPGLRFSRLGDKDRPLSATDRAVTRLSRALKQYRDTVSRSDLGEIAAEILEGLTRTRDPVWGSDFGLMYLRQWVEDKVLSGHDFLLVTLLTAAAAVHVASPRTDDRANALMLLAHLASFDGHSMPGRLLRLRLAREPDWEVARCCLPRTGRSRQWWPPRLYGVERSLLRKKAEGWGAPRDALPHLHPDIRLALEERRQDLAFNALPAVFRVDVSLHWIRRLLAEIDEAKLRGLDLDDMGNRLTLQMIDVELAYRDLEPHVADLITNAALGQGKVGLCLDRIAEVTFSLVAVSERSGGWPLASFAEFFVDHMLPLLGLLIVRGSNAEPMQELARRALAILEPFAPRREISAYTVFIDDCVAWKQTDRTMPCPDAPVVVEHDRLRIKSATFRSAWLQAARPAFPHL